MPRAAPKPGVDGVPYVASNTFVIPDHDPTVVRRFEQEMAERETLMKSMPGFTHCALVKDAEGFTFTQEWTTKQAGDRSRAAPRPRARPIRRNHHMRASIRLAGINPPRDGEESVFLSLVEPFVLLKPLWTPARDD